MITGGTSSQALDDSKVVGNRSMSLIENPKIRFRDSSSTAKPLFDKYKGITRRRRRKDRVKL